MCLLVFWACYCPLFCVETYVLFLGVFLLSRGASSFLHGVQIGHLELGSQLEHLAEDGGGKGPYLVVFVIQRLIGRIVGDKGQTLVPFFSFLIVTPYSSARRSSEVLLIAAVPRSQYE